MLGYKIKCKICPDAKNINVHVPSTLSFACDLTSFFAAATAAVTASTRCLRRDFSKISVGCLAMGYPSGSSSLWLWNIEEYYTLTIYLWKEFLSSAAPIYINLIYLELSAPIAVFPNEGRPRTPALQSESKLSRSSPTLCLPIISPDILNTRSNFKTSIDNFHITIFVQQCVKIFLI